MKNIKKYLGVLENQLATLFEKAPHLPKDIREILITIAPWCALILGIIGIVALFSASAFAVLLTLTTFGLTIGLFVPIIIGFIATLFALSSYPGLSAGSKEGWERLFYCQIVSIIGVIVSMLWNHLSFGSILGPLIGFYLLFEIRSHYK